MRRFKTFILTVLCLVPLSPVALAEDFVLPEPPSYGYILDDAQILSSETEIAINAQLELLEEETSTQMVIVTLETLDGHVIEDISLMIGREWGVGQAEYDNGLVFLVVPSERQVRIEVGRGLEGSITDANSALILNQVVSPNFKNEDYDTGVQEAMNYLEGLARDEDFDLSALGTSGNSDEDIFAFIATFGIFFAWIALSLMSQSKSWWAGGVFGAIIGGIIAGSLTGAIIVGVIGLFADYIASTYFYKKIKMNSGGRRGGGSGGFGGFSGGGSSGGGFSGGGGSFGGGGSSGSW